MLKSAKKKARNRIFGFEKGIVRLECSYLDINGEEDYF